MMASDIREINNRSDSLTRSIENVIGTLDEYLIQNITSQDSVIPVIGLNEDGSLGLFEGGKPIPIDILERGETQEKVIVQREIIISSDGKNKQTVEEIDFDGDFFTASRTGTKIEVSLKDRASFLVYISDEDPVKNELIRDGDFWFLSLFGKMYVRYDGVWVQPHPQ